MVAGSLLLLLRRSLAIFVTSLSCSLPSSLPLFPFALHARPDYLRCSPLSLSPLSPLFPHSRKCARSVLTHSVCLCSLHFRTLIDLEISVIGLLNFLFVNWLPPPIAGQIDTIQTQIITKPYTRPRILLFNPTRYSLAMCRVWCTKIATCLIRGQSRLKFAWTLRSELWALCQLFGVKFVLESVKGVLGRSTSILASRLSKPAGTNYFSKISSVWWWWRGEERGEGLAWLVKNRKELSGNEGGREEAAELVIGFRSWNRD